MARNVIYVAEKNSIICQGIISAVDIHRKAIESIILINLIKKIFFFIFYSLISLQIIIHFSNNFTLMENIKFHAQRII